MVVAFGRIIKVDVLERLPMVNAHFSLLPRWRGAAPVERAILAGDEETGVCLMAIEEGLDSGPVYCCQRTPIGEEETAAELRSRLSMMAADMLVELLRTVPGVPIPQEGEPTYAAKVETADLHLDWDRPAAELRRIVRVGRAWTTWRGRRLLVWSVEPSVAPAGLRPGQLNGDVVATGDGGLRLLVVQPEGRPPQPAADWGRGARLSPGEALGE